MDDNPMSEMAQFKQYLTYQLEERLTKEIPHQGFDDDVDKVVVAQVTFAFRNTQMIEWLNKRGTLIKESKWQELEELNEEIVKGISSKDKVVNGMTQLDALQTPCSAFITFLEEESIERAMALPRLLKEGKIDKSLGYLLGDKLDIKKTGEPSDVIWQNRF